MRGNKLKGFSARAAFEAITYVFFGTLSGDIENLKAMRALRGRVVLAQRPISKLIGKKWTHSRQSYISVEGLTLCHAMELSLSASRAPLRVPAKHLLVAQKPMGLSHAYLVAAVTRLQLSIQSTKQWCKVIFLFKTTGSGCFVS